MHALAPTHQDHFRTPPVSTGFFVVPSPAFTRRRFDANPNAIPQGIWLPLVTPFKDGEFDELSARRLARHYAAAPVDGFILGATTGEGLTLDDERPSVLRTCAGRRSTVRPARAALPRTVRQRHAQGRQALARTSSWPIDGYLVVCPYYTRPSQLGLYRHFSALADATSKPMMLYNIPYRTGVNLGNEQMLRLAGHPSIVGVKDCSADPAQSFDLMRHRPPGFAVLTGEDALFYGAPHPGSRRWRACLRAYRNRRRLQTSGIRC